MPQPIRFFGLIPAAGVGRRVASANGPKQYLALGCKTMLEHAIDALLADARIVQVFVVVAPDDVRWEALAVDRARVAFLPVGGGTRAESVRNGLAAIAARTRDGDCVLVHDAARPCLGAAQLAALIDTVGADEHGGLLAVPLADTLKRGEDGRVGATIDRAALWCAQTPQLFRIGSLRAALAGAALEGITDEASAMERAGHAPRLVEGVSSNLKVTSAADIVLAEAILAAQQRLHGNRA